MFQIAHAVSGSFDSLIEYRAFTAVLAGDAEGVTEAHPQAAIMLAMGSVSSKEKACPK
jgi:hypothetical protein